MPPSASSKRPDAIRLRIRERAFHVAEKFAFENAFGQAAGVHGDERTPDSRRESVERARDHFFSGAVLAGDEDVGVRRADARDQVQHRTHRGGFGDQRRASIGAQETILGFEALAFAQSLRKLDLSFQDREQARVLPGLLDEILGAAAHRFDGEFEAAPRRHHDDGKRAVFRPDVREQIEAFLAGGGVARVVQVHQQPVEFAGFERGEHCGRRCDGLDVESFAFQQQTQSFANVRLVICNQNSCAVRMWACHDARSVSSHFTAIIVAKRFGCVVHGFTRYS